VGLLAGQISETEPSWRATAAAAGPGTGTSRNRHPTQSVFENDFPLSHLWHMLVAQLRRPASLTCFADPASPPLPVSEVKPKPGFFCSPACRLLPRRSSLGVFSSRLDLCLFACSCFEATLNSASLHLSRFRIWLRFFNPFRRVTCDHAVARGHAPRGTSTGARCHLQRKIVIPSTRVLAQ
jgi:hypothetical protein